MASCQLLSVLHHLDQRMGQHDRYVALIAREDAHIALSYPRTLLILGARSLSAGAKRNTDCVNR